MFRTPQSPLLTPGTGKGQSMDEHSIWLGQVQSTEKPGLDMPLKKECVRAQGRGRQHHSNRGSQEQLTAPETPPYSSQDSCGLTVLGLLMAAGCPNSVIIFQVT